MSCGQDGWRAPAASYPASLPPPRSWEASAWPCTGVALAVVTQTGRLSRELHQQMRGNGLTQWRELGPTERSEVLVTKQNNGTLKMHVFLCLSVCVWPFC